MKRVTHKFTGDGGERDVIRLVKCPNCSKPLTLLPVSYPLCDVQCTACHFRSQIKTSRSKPKDTVRGAGWDIMYRVLKAGYLVPPLIVNFVWDENGMKRQEIRFYPFIRKMELHPYTAKISRRSQLYKMFDYHLKNAQFYVLHSR
jgi:hypothetical protein